MAEHRPTATLQVDIFPEDSFLLDADDDEMDENDYTPEQVAREAWSNISDWVMQGYQPVITVTMPDGTEHLIDTEETG